MSRYAFRVRAALAAMLVSAAPATGGSLRFVENKPEAYDFADLPRLPAAFGRGEFALELWIKPDTSYPVGMVLRAGYSQLKNWSDADPEPYSSHSWWLTGNWLLDGHTRPRGFAPGDSREGTLSLQFYGGGRLRFMFADATEGMPKGMVYTAQAWPATSTPSLLDGRWHHVVAVRRWREPSGATLELWIDGRRIATTDISHRTDMRRFWDKLAHPDDPPQLGGWAMGAEVMTAWNYTFTQYEDYKGLVDEMRLWGRAPSAEEIGGWAAGRPPVRRDDLLARFAFDEGRGDKARDAIDPAFAIELHRMGPANWVGEDAPAGK